jgi:hypothetical protein
MQARLESVERRVRLLSEQIAAVVHRTAELDKLRDEVARLKYEMEELSETGR